MNLKANIQRLEDMNFCPLCLTSFRDSDQIDHDACEIFTDIDYETDRTRISIKKLNQYNGDWSNLLTIALYTLLIPWDIKPQDLSYWFLNIEYLLLSVENEDIPQTNIYDALLEIENDLFCVKRISLDRIYNMQQGYKLWNYKKPLYPLDFFTRYLQQNREIVRLKKIKSSKTILKTLFDKIGLKLSDNQEIPQNWFKIKKTSRDLFYYKKEDKILSIRSINGKPIFSSIFTVDGKWIGWKISEEELFEIPTMPRQVPSSIQKKSHIITRWNRLLNSREELNKFKNIISAHGMILHGDPNPKISDQAAKRGNAEITASGEGTVFEQISILNDKTKDFKGEYLPCPEKIDANELIKKGNNSIKKLTRFNSSRNNIQAQAIGWVIKHDNNLLSIVMPTGTGKSLIPLCASVNNLSKIRQERPITVVICPLISLLDDQLNTAVKDAEHKEFCNKRSVHKIHHLLDKKDREEIFKNIASGECVLLFLTAEQLQRETIIQTLSKRNINWLFIDEAHGVLEFEDYRPAYARIWYPINRLKKSSPNMGIAIQSATLPVSHENKVWAKLLKNKDCKNPVSFRSNKIRPNLIFNNVQKFDRNQTWDRNDASIEQAITDVKNNKKTILYTLYLRHERYFESMYRQLLDELKDYTIGYYCGQGCKINNTQISKNEYMNFFSEGKIDLTLATMAFGLGINRRDVESVIFNGVPSSLNTLYQQAGRAARGINKDGNYEYTGNVHLFIQEDEDFHHQSHLSSYQRLYANTAIRIIECMISSEKSHKITEGVYLLDFTIPTNSRVDPGPSTIDKTNNLNTLRILTEIGAIEWISTLPDQIRIQRDSIKDLLNIDLEKLFSETKCEEIGDNILKIKTSDLFSLKFQSKKTSISSCYQFIQDILSASCNIPLTWDIDIQKYALITWLWNKDKYALGELISRWRVKDELEYREEEEHVKKFLSKKNHKERISVLAKYYNFEI